MKILALLIAIALAALFAVPSVSASAQCRTSSDHIDIAGVAYIRTAQGGSNDAEDFYYLESNGIPGLQYGSAHAVMGWSELDGNGGPCEDGDILLV